MPSIKDASDIGQMCDLSMYPAIPGHTRGGHILYSSKHAQATDCPNLIELANLLNALTQKSGTKQISAHVLPNPALEYKTWADTIGLVPSVFLRTSIFSASRKEVGAHLCNCILPTSNKNTVLLVNGEQLGQLDLDIWMQAIYLCRFHANIDQTCKVEFKALLRKIGYKVTGGKDIIRLQQSLNRLSNYAFAWMEQEEIYLSTLLNYNNIQGTLSLPHPVASLINNKGYTLLDLSIRQALTTSRAKWLHAFWATHANPKPYNLKTLMKLCAENNSEKRSYLQKWRQALDELTTNGVFEQAQITPKGLMEIVKPAK